MDVHKKLEWALRIGVAGEFFGHGVLSIEGKADFVKWIGLILHVSTETATMLLLVIGIVDVLLALLVLFKPMPKALLWMAFWGFWTALVRPIVMYLGVTTTGWMDFVERFANWGAPLALYYFYKAHGNSK